MDKNRDFYINVSGQLVSVSEEIYLAYYRSKRRDRYFERDIKTGAAIRDETGNITGYKPSREDSFERLIDFGKVFIAVDADTASEVEHSVMSERLHTALAMLTDTEKELIAALFFADGGKGMTERKYAAISGIPQQTINSRKARIIAKLKKLIDS